MPSSLALAFIAADELVRVEPDGAPERRHGAVVRRHQRRVQQIAIGERQADRQPRARAAEGDLLDRSSIMVVGASRSRWREGSSTTSIAISFEIDAIGRTASGFFMYSSSPVVRSIATAACACTLGMPPCVYVAIGARALGQRQSREHRHQDQGSQRALHRTFNSGRLTAKGNSFAPSEPVE